MCNSYIQHVIKHDKKQKFRFASLQSSLGQEIIKTHKMSDIDSVLLLDQSQIYSHSDVALRVTKEFGGLWSMFSIFSLIPASLRNRVYNLIAKNRYKWFGKKDVCMMPSPELKDLFLED